MKQLIQALEDLSMNILIYVAGTLLAGAICGACLANGLVPPRPSVLWAIPFSLIFLFGVFLGALPFGPR